MGKTAGKRTHLEMTEEPLETGAAEQLPKVDHGFESLMKYGDHIEVFRNYSFRTRIAFITTLWVGSCSARWVCWPSTDSFLIQEALFVALEFDENRFMITYNAAWNMTSHKWFPSKVISTSRRYIMLEKIAMESSLWQLSCHTRLRFCIEIFLRPRAVVPGNSPLDLQEVTCKFEVHDTCGQKKASGCPLYPLLSTWIRSLIHETTSELTTWSDSKKVSGLRNTSSWSKGSWAQLEHLDHSPLPTVSGSCRGPLSVSGRRINHLVGNVDLEWPQQFLYALPVHYSDSHRNTKALGLIWNDGNDFDTVYTLQYLYTPVQFCTVIQIVTQKPLDWFAAQYLRFVWSRWRIHSVTRCGRFNGEKIVFSEV